MTNKADVTIEGTVRTAVGKSQVRKLRKSGLLPAVLNAGGKSTLVQFDPKFLSRAWRDGGKEFDLVLGGKTQRVKITELQLDAVKRLAVHCDLAPVG